MPDINLLGSNQSPVNIEHRASLAVKLLGLILILVLAYYAYLFIQARRVNAQSKSVQNKIVQTQTEALSMKDRQELVTRQGQLQNADTLVKEHVFWSYLLSELARVTLKSTTYASITAEDEGILTLTVTAPTYAELDKYLQVFNLPQFNKEFSDVKVMSILKTQDENTVQNEMKVQLKFNPAFIRNRFAPNAQ